MGLRMHFPFSFITKRVDVSMGCQRCESHKPVMAAVAEIKWWVNGMPIKVFFGPGLLAKEIRPRARCFRNPMHVMNCSYGVQLIAAVAAYSWLQSRGLTLSVSLHMETGKVRPRGRGSDGRADPTTRPTFPQSHACSNNHIASTCATNRQVQLMAAVAA